MTTAIVCNGVRVGAAEFSQELTQLLTGVIQEVRKHYILGDDQIKGSRFNDDEAVLLSIRSSANEEAARTAPLSWAHAALEDCASRDYHYAFEKEWDDKDFGGEG